MSARRTATMLAAVGAIALLAGWMLWPGDEPAADAGGTVKVVPAPAASRATTPPTVQPTIAPRMLAGVWSLRDNRGDVRVACDLLSAVTYLPGGQYQAPDRSGRYAADTRSVSYSETIRYDVDLNEDRSQFAVRTTEPLEWLTDAAVRIGRQTYYRCERRDPKEK